MPHENPKSAKKLRERHALAALEAIDSSFPPGRVSQGEEGEEPDFVVDLNGGKPLGIEVTEYFTPPTTGRWSLKEREPLTYEVARDATRQCKSAGVTNLLASVEFDPQAEIRKQHTNALAKQIASLVAPASANRLPTLRICRKDLLPKGVNDIWAHYRSNSEDPFIGVAWGGAVRPADEVQILRLVANKEEKLRMYRQHCSTMWLLLLVDPYGAASMGYVPPDFRLRASGFDRVVAVQSWSHTTELWRASAVLAP